MKTSFEKQKNISGFTLIEVAVVLAVGAFLLVGVTKLSSNYMENGRYEDTDIKIDKVTKALQRYLDINGTLPCPAPLTAAPDSATFGIASCDSSPSTGLYLVNGPDGKDVRIGALPVRTLNIDDTLMFDGWNRRLTYAITRGIIPSSTGEPLEGAIGLNDSNGNPAFMPEETLPYIIVSHGPNGLGAYTFSGKLYKSCVTSSVEGKNCDHNNNIFATTMTKSTNGDAYDDYVRYDLLNLRGLNKSTSSLQDGVVAFDLDTCPDGWAAVPELAGRAIYSVGSIVSGEGHSEDTSYMRQMDGVATLRMDPNSLYHYGERRGHKHELRVINISGIETNPTTGYVLYTPASSPGSATPQVEEVGGDGSGEAGLQDNRQPFRVYTYCKKG